MSYDTIASLQRMQQLEQAQAAAGKRLVLQRVHTTDNLLAVLAIILVIPTFSLSLVLFCIYYIVKSLVTKTYLVKNVATGEKFHVDKEEFKQYKKKFKKKEKQVRRISDL
ncbi:hypothetical protein P9Y62_01535 [Bacillus thuringiensis]|uniref:Transmembrane protein n=1 Tax=Bacillus thuringiensis HD-771 TaxID=1218175 RepID=A0A9W3NZK2_BACTU|nr:hypothetical protein [Bacillus thuringiensis]AFQ18200.1 hypothetical protein BTG_23940 [Bacillus thuringiensis HD-771]MEB4890993.1 hypothetical protein [Bacillus thuringiensis]MEC2563535.1 hypothetical protein [Bacillus thuringiensis]MEC2644654.1 hypothetical protein [Bacillus thuringiensis]MEC2723532.1 hypothetical protein [Bacillus thuringiensis]